MLGIFAQSPQYYGDRVQLHIYGNTGGKELGFWLPKILFNIEYLQFISVSVPNNLWENPVLLLEIAEINKRGILESYSGKADGVLDGEVSFKCF